MTIDFTLQQQVFLHSLDNPPVQDRTCSITLNLINSTAALELIKFGPGYQTEYILRIEEPLKIGFTSSSQSGAQTDLRNFVLAMNLALARTCVILQKVEFVDNSIKLKPVPPKPAVVRDDGRGNFSVSIEERVVLSDHVGIAFGTSENIDESAVIAIFKKLQNLKRLEIGSSSALQDFNLSKALDAFEFAMKDFERLAIFKHLYTAIELGANYDGSKDDGKKLDAKVSVLTGEDEGNLAVWRELNNRSKHADFKPEQAEAFLRGRDGLGVENNRVRKCAESAILARLP